MQDVTRLKNHLNVMKKELDHANKQINQFKKNHSTSEWDNINSINGISIDELKIQEKNLSNEINQVQKEIKKSQSKTLLITVIF